MVELNNFLSSEPRGEKEVAKTCRFAAGEKLGLKSCIWKVEVRKNDVYIFTRLFGENCKISLHESGAGQWSLTSEYVKKQVGMTNRERHIAQWAFARPVGQLATSIFRIQIPHSELRSYPADQIKRRVKWASGIALGTYQFDLYLTCPTAVDPTKARTDLPFMVIGSLQLKDSRWLVIMVQAVGLSPVELAAAKEAVVGEMVSKGVDMNGDRWIAMFGKCDDGVPLLLEFHHDHAHRAA